MGDVGISVLLDGNLIQASGLARFTYIPTGKEYLVYTLNEKTNQNGKELEKIYVSETGEGNTVLSEISDNDKSNIRPVLMALSKTDEELPNNIQVGLMSSKQYTVGPYYKIAVEAQMKNGILATQLAKQPSADQEVAAPTGENQFIVTPEEPAEDVVQTQTVVQDAFTMSAPQPEQTAPTTLISEPTTTTVENVPQQEIIPAPPAVQVVEQPVVQEPVVQQVVVPTQTVDINKSAQDIINYANGDVNKVIDLFKTNGLDLAINTQVVQPVEQQAVQEVVAPVEAPVANPSININDLPVAEQPIALPSEELNEESIVPSTPSLPVDDNQNPQLVQTTVAPVPAMQEQTIPVTQVVTTPTVPVQQPTVPVQQTEIVQPVVQEPVVQQTTIVQEPTIPVTQVVENPTVPVQQPTIPVQQTEIVQPVVQEPVIQQTTIVQEPTIPVQQPTEVVQPTPQQEVVTNTIVQEPVAQEPIGQATAEITQNMQNSTVSFDIPEEPTQAVENNNVSGIPTILPLTAEDLQPQTPSESPSGVDKPADAPSVEDDKSFLNEAGPVVMPIGQEQTNAVGYPGDSGQN